MMSMFMIFHLKAYSIAVVKRRRILKIFGGLTHTDLNIHVS